MGDTKKCKYCQSDIPKKAKVCPVCKKSQGNKAMALLIIILTILIIFFIAIGGSDSDESSDEQKQYVTYEQFMQIEKGMTQAEVESILGYEGECLSEVGDEDEVISAIMYCWYGKDRISNMNITFMNGVVYSKAQIGLNK